MEIRVPLSVYIANDVWDNKFYDYKTLNTIQVNQQVEKKLRLQIAECINYMNNLSASFFLTVIVTVAYSAPLSSEEEVMNQLLSRKEGLKVKFY